MKHEKVVGENKIKKICMCRENTQINEIIYSFEKKKIYFELKRYNELTCFISNCQFYIEIDHLYKY